MTDAEVEVLKERVAAAAKPLTAQALIYLIRHPSPTTKRRTRVAIPRRPDLR